MFNIFRIQKKAYRKDHFTVVCDCLEVISTGKLPRGSYFSLIHFHTGSILMRQSLWTLGRRPMLMVSFTSKDIDFYIPDFQYVKQSKCFWFLTHFPHTLLKRTYYACFQLYDFIGAPYYSSYGWLTVQIYLIFYRDASCNPQFIFCS